MLWKYCFILLIALAETYHIDFGPPGDQFCILADIETENTLTRTDLKTMKTDAAPSYTLDGSSIISGSCDDSSRNVVLEWSKNRATIEFVFKNDTDVVGMSLVFTFVPFNIWQNGSKENVSMEAFQIVGHTNASYMCHSLTFHFKTEQDGFIYRADWRMRDFHVQAFNLENNTYSLDEECPDDQKTSTIEPVTGTTEAPNDHPLNTYTFNDTDHMSTVCVRMQVEILFHIPYQGQDGTSKSAEIGVPSQTEVAVSGSCNVTGDGENMLELKFRDNWSLVFLFANSDLGASPNTDKDKQFWLKLVNLTFTYDSTLFPNINASYVKKTNVILTNFSGKGQYQTSMGGSYLCKADTTVDLWQGVKMETWNLQYFAFENKTQFDNNKISDCSADNQPTKTSKEVPIAVGAALAALVILVVVAYFIGRRRRKRGFDSSMELFGFGWGSSDNEDCKKEIE